MKFSIKFAILIYLLVSSYGLEVSSSIKSNKTKTRKIGITKRGHSNFKCKLSLKDKLKAFFFGFILGAITIVTVGNESTYATDATGKEQEEYRKKMKLIATNMISICMPEFLHEYEAGVKEVNTDKGYENKKINMLFKDKEIDEIMPICEKKDVITKLGDNEYSSPSLIAGGALYYFTNSNYYNDFTQFKSNKKALDEEINKLNSKYSQLFEKRKSKLKDAKAKEITEQAYNSLNAYSISKKDICEIMSSFSQISLMDHLKSLFLASLKTFLCTATTFATYFPQVSLEKLIKKIIEILGVSAAKSAIANAFPPALASYIISFVWSNFSSLMKFGKVFLVDGKDNAELNMYETIGILAGKNIVNWFKSKKKLRKLFK